MSVNLTDVGIVLWQANYSGSAPTIDDSDNVKVGHFARDTSTTPYTLWVCVDETEGSPVWYKLPVQGVVSTSSFVVVDANKDIGDFRNLDAVNIDAGSSGTAGTVDIFPSTASKGKFIIAPADNAGNTNITLTNASHGQATVVTLPDSGLATSYIMQSTAAITVAEADVLDGAVAGTQASSKVVLPDSNVNIGTTKITTLHLGTSGAETQITATGAEINLLASKTLSGSDTTIITGTAGTAGNTAQWNADGDIVNGINVQSTIFATG